jgi:hypothetical protein
VTQESGRLCGTCPKAILAGSTVSPAAVRRGIRRGVCVSGPLCRLRNRSAGTIRHQSGRWSKLLYQLPERSVPGYSISLPAVRSCDRTVYSAHRRLCPLQTKATAVSVSRMSGHVRRRRPASHSFRQVELRGHDDPSTGNDAAAPSTGSAAGTTAGVGSADSASLATASRPPVQSGSIDCGAAEPRFEPAL